MSAGFNHALITGATGGIGAEIAAGLAGPGRTLSLVGRDGATLAALAERLGARGGRIATFRADLSRLDGIQALAQGVAAANGPVDLLINNAAVNWFGRFETMPEAELARLLDTDVAAPMRLARAVLPEMIRRRCGRIVNVGSVFGSIGFAGFAAYSASKFALRGFSEALRRELRGSGVDVAYIAPRYTRTPANGAAIDGMAGALGWRGDAPDAVARRIVAAVLRGEAELTIGARERIFVRLNAVWPRLVDAGLARSTARILSFARPPG